MWLTKGNTNGNDECTSIIQTVHYQYKYVPLNGFKVVSREHKSQGLRAGRPNDQTATNEGALLRQSRTEAVVAQKKKGTAVC
jgi:hypothetical protein